MYSTRKYTWPLTFLIHFILIITSILVELIKKMRLKITIQIILTSFLTCLFVFVSSCGKNETTLDGSSPEKAEQSLERMLSELNQEKKKELKEACALLMFKYAAQNMMSQPIDHTGEVSKEDDGKIANAFLEVIDGKTADEIIAMANALKNTEKIPSN